VTLRFGLMLPNRATAVGTGTSGKSGRRERASGKSLMADNRQVLNITATVAVPGFEALPRRVIRTRSVEHYG